MSWLQWIYWPNPGARSCCHRGWSIRSCGRSICRFWRTRCSGIGNRFSGWSGSCWVVEIICWVRPSIRCWNYYWNNWFIWQKLACIPKAIKVLQICGSIEKLRIVSRLVFLPGWNEPVLYAPLSLCLYAIMTKNASILSIKYIIIFCMTPKWNQMPQIPLLELSKVVLSHD